MHGTVVPEGGRYSANVRDAKYDHCLGSLYSRGVFVLLAGRASSSSRPPAALSESAVGMAEVVCFVGAAATDRVSTWLLTVVQSLSAIAAGLDVVPARHRAQRGRGR
jgi:hypothetical protein